MEGVVLWSGGYVAADGFLQFYRDGGEVSTSEESITHPSTQMDGEWYYPPPFGPTSAYYSELSGIGITFPNGDVVQWNPIVSENVVFTEVMLVAKCYCGCATAHTVAARVV